MKYDRHSIHNYQTKTTLSQDVNIFKINSFFSNVASLKKILLIIIMH